MKMKAPKVIVEYDGTEVECRVTALYFYIVSGNMSGMNVWYSGYEEKLSLAPDGTFKNRDGNMTAKLIEE